MRQRPAAPCGGLRVSVDQSTQLPGALARIIECMGIRLAREGTFA